MGFTFDSIIFHTAQLIEVRKFYEDLLGFPTGTYEKNGEVLPDFSATYVNYHIGGGLICFEQISNSQPSTPDIGDIVIRVSDFNLFLQKVKSAHIPVLKESSFFFMIHDPEKRTLIFEPSK